MPARLNTPPPSRHRYGHAPTNQVDCKSEPLLTAQIPEARLQFRLREALECGAGADDWRPVLECVP